MNEEGMRTEKVGELKTLRSRAGLKIGKGKGTGKKREKSDGKERRSGDRNREKM